MKDVKTMQIRVIQFDGSAVKYIESNAISSNYYIAVRVQTRI